MPATDYVRARIDPVIKEEAANVLAGIGLTVSDACRMMLTKIARDKCLPFGHEPNAETIEVLEQIERKENLHCAKDADDLFAQLGI